MIDNMEGSFTFEYDVTLDRVDDGATFRFGLTGPEMDFNKGPNVITMFSNGKHDNIMSLHIVTVGAKQLEVNSVNDDELTSGSIAYKGSTVRFALNKTYHVAVEYDESSRTTTMRVSDKASGQEIWSYFIKTVESLHDMNRIYLGSRGDYGTMYARASGYIDNVRLTKAVEPAQQQEVTFGTPALTAQQTTAPPPTTRKPVLQHTIPPTPLSTDTPQSPSLILTVLLSLGITGAGYALCSRKKH